MSGWRRRHRAKLRLNELGIRMKGAQAGWKNPQPILRPYFPLRPDEGAFWDSNSRFTENRSVLGIFVHVNNEDLYEPGRWLAAARISNVVKSIARNAIHDESERRITERVAAQVRRGR
jgi:hypothetical protein